MAFVDGSNFLNALRRTYNLQLDDGRPTREALAVAMYAVQHARQLSRPSSVIMTELARAYWVGSAHGQDREREALADCVREAGFEPVLLPKAKGAEEKGVDMTLAVTMLSHAFARNFDVALLVAGDADYVRLVDEVKRHGPRVVVAAFESGLAPALRRAADGYIRLAEEVGDLKGPIAALKKSAKTATSRPGAPKAGRVSVALQEFSAARDLAAEERETAFKTLEEVLGAEIGAPVSIGRETPDSGRPVAQA